MFFMFKFLKEKISGLFSKKEEVKEDSKLGGKKTKEKTSKKAEKKARNEKKGDIKKSKKELKLNLEKDTGKRKKEEKIVLDIENKDVEKSKDLIAEETHEEVYEKTEEIKELEELKEEIKEEREEKGGFFSRLVKRISTSELKREEFEEFFSEFEMALLENNVALEVVDKIKETLDKELVGNHFGRGEAENKIGEALRKAIDSVLIEGEDLIEKIRAKEGSYVILFFGINGSGKTTSIAKLAYKLKKEGISCVLCAADTFRAAAIEQLETHALKIGVPIIKKEYMADPASVAFEAIQYAKKNKIKVVLIDTAGRMYTKANLMREMEKIVRVANADMKIFVGESITGNDATEQAKTFNESAGIDGVILSKADIDDKAGTILSVGYITGKPILFLGVGQEYSDLKRFQKKDVLKGLGLE